MKKIILLAVLALNLTTVMAEQIKGVYLCAAQCNSESLAMYPMGEASVGQIYYAEKPEDCVPSPKSIDIVSNRMTDDSLIACTEVLLNKYYGKKVDINTATERASEDNDLGTYLSIKLSK